MLGSAVIHEKIYTYQDYLNFPDEERWEIIDGKAYDMSPAPKVKHQRIVGLLYRKLADKIEQMGCSIFIAPTDVVFDEYNVVQPDVFIVCDMNKITEDNIQGAPDLIVEVISSGTALKDRRVKKNLYERFGVKEYIIVFPEKEYVERFCLEGSKFGAGEIFQWNEWYKFCSFEIEVELWEVFERIKKNSSSVI